jgi:hypothetical protein
MAHIQGRILFVAFIGCFMLSATLCPVRGGAIADKWTGSETAPVIAQAFIESDETFRYDGLRETLNIMPIAVGREEYMVKAKFDCSHSGYGDRTGKFLAQAITPHEAEIVISSGNVRSAVMDSRWDMIAEKPL